MHAVCPVQVARVVSVQPHPNSDKLYICKVDAGEGKERQVRHRQ